LIDYRYFDYYNISVQYEFGLGLSYTTFSLSNLCITPSQVTSPLSPALQTANKTAPGGNPDLWNTVYGASVTVSNTGSVAGAAVTQLYLTSPTTAVEGTPVKQLRGFEKIELAVNVSSTVQFDLMRQNISFWDVVAQEWRIPSGEFGIKVGFSSRGGGTFSV
jgi:beta-glucosidase